MKVVDAAMEYAAELFRDNAGGHDAGHTLRVYRTAMRLADSEPACDRELVALGALLHDADDPKLFGTENNENARTFLLSQGLAADRIDQVCRVVNAVSFSRNRGRRPDTPEGRIVQDADRLDAIGAVGIARTFAYGGEHGRPMESSVRHFDEKLLLLRDEMNTAAARELAQGRHRFMEQFLMELKEETGT